VAQQTFFFPPVTARRSPTFPDLSLNKFLFGQIFSGGHSMRSRLLSLTAFLVMNVVVVFAQMEAPKLVIASLEHSFGTVKPGTPLTFSFQVRNDGKAVLEIKSVSPSCGCTTSNFDKSVAPGKTGSITLAVEKTDGYKGEVVKTATVSTNDPDHSNFTLTLRANFGGE
jgi:uncharacterized protein DUF1573